MSGPGKVEMQEFEIPKLEEGSILLKVEACSICGTDKHIYLGHSPRSPFPFILGHEVIGRIEQMDSRANEMMRVFDGELKVGDRVALVPGGKNCGECHYCLTMPNRPSFCINRTPSYGFTSVNREPSLFGGYSEYLYVLPYSYLFKVPEDMPQKKAVLIEAAATALRAVERAYSPGEPEFNHGYGVGRSAMVLGAGGVGLLTVAALRHSGAGLIIVQDLLPSRLELAKQLGADVVVDGNLPLEDRLEQVREVTYGVGPDVAIEAAGVPVAFKEALDFVRRGGKLVEVGNFTNNGPTEITPYDIVFKDLDIHGSWGYPAVTFRDVISMLKQTSLPVEEVVTHVLPLEEYPRGLELTGSKDAGKVAIAP